MKRQFLISLFVLFFLSNLAVAVDLQQFGFSDPPGGASAAYKQDELIVRFADPETGSQLPEGPVLAGPLTRSAIRSKISDYIVAGAVVDRECDEVSAGVAVVKLPEGTNVLEAGIKFLQSANVLYAEPNYKYRLFAVPNDPFFPDLWGLDNTGQTGGTPDADIDAPEAWDITTGSSDIVVAVIDSGIDYMHPDLAANMWVNAAEQNGSPGVDDDNNGYIDDIYGYDFAGASATRSNDGKSDPKDSWFHGTHVAGIIGAVGNNGLGVAGVCWNVKLMALKIFADDFNTVPAVFASDAMLAVQYAVDNGADIINASWGGEYDSQALKEAIEKAGDAGVLFVAAAGNDSGSDNDATPVYPASYDLDNIISVMSTDPNDMISGFSNFGATSVDIAAPGTDIVSTTPTVGNMAMTVFGVSTNYGMIPTSDMFGGTSASTGYVSGACALVWSHYPALPKEVIKGLLMKTVDPVLANPKRCLSGGRLNLYNALTLIPPGKPGRVINTKNPGQLYNTIQAAIDEAVDGDELVAEAGTLFFEGIDFDGKAITLRSGDINEPSDANISPENTVILGMLSDGSTVTFANNEGPNTVLKGLTISRGDTDYGGGITCNGASPTITDCIISNNAAKFYGAGIDCTNGSSPLITNCTITGNQTKGSSAIGGGINIENSSPKIENCTISYNFADNVGGGIACYNSNPTIFNCLIANNSAVYLGGGIDLENSSPAITNCTIIVDDPNAPKDGGIFADQDSSPVITNCILWGNGDDLFNCTATYSCIEDDDQGTGNIHIMPTFVTGPLGNYYLSQKAAGQLTDSTCIDIGNPDTDPTLQLNTYTTRTDGQTDAGIADMGFHYPAIPAKIVQLNITVAGNGTIEPGSGTYRQYEVVQLKADPNEGYRIKSWTGTEDDSSLVPDKTITMVADTNITIEFELIPLHQLITRVIGGHGRISPDHRRGELYPEGTVVTLTAEPESTYGIDKWTGTDDDTSWLTKNTVTMDSDKEVTVLFRQPRSLHVPGQYATIENAINAAYNHGDKVIVSAGTYPGIPGGFDFQGKAITVASEHPDDPTSVAATIIDCGGTTRAFLFQSGEGNDSVVDGFTIINGSAVPTINPPNTGGTGAAGANAFGGAIACMNGSSPTISNLIISSTNAWGQSGEDASFIYPAPAPAPPVLEPLEPNAPFPDYPDIDPNDPTSYDPNNVQTWDPNNPWDPSLPWDPNTYGTPDPSSAIDGQNGQNGANGLDGEPGADGANGADAYNGGNGGLGYGGAMYFDANCAPVILHCTITDCNAVGGNGGFGGRGQDGQAGQDGQDGQPGQDGQAGQAGYNGGQDGAGGNGGNGGAGGPGGKGGNGGKGGDGGAGAEALGGAIYFGPDCRPTIRFCTIQNCMTTQGTGSRGGVGGAGGAGGANGGAGGTGGAGGAPNGADGTDNSSTTAAGGDGGTGGDGGNATPDGARTWAGAIYFGENCEVDISDTIIANNATSTITRSDPFDPNAGGDPNAFQPGTGGAAGTDGAAGGDGSAGSSSDPSSVTTFGGGNYYEPGVKVKMTNCTISNNFSEQHDGGGEFYSEGSTGVFNKSEFTGNGARYGAGQFFDLNCSIEVDDCEYGDNVASVDGGGLFILYDCTLDVDDSRFSNNMALGDGGGIYGGGQFDDVNEFVWYNHSTIKVEDTEFYRNSAGFGGGMYWHGDDSEVKVSYCKFDDNSADAGGGLYFSNGAPRIISCTITNNDTVDPTPTTTSPMPGTIFGDVPYGGGGGIFCWSSDARIEDCIITDNSSVGSGGGVYLGGDPSAPLLKNCLIKENSAAIDGGGVVANWFVEPTIANCSIINNQALDISDPSRGNGGGLSCTYESKTTLINSILWYNRSATGNQIAIGSQTDPTYLDRPATLTVSYSDIQGGQSDQAVHVEPGRTLNWLAGNINAEPLFVGLNFLSQNQAGQTVNSPCVDAGSDLASKLSLDNYTTRTDHVADANVVDMGYHYIVRGPEQELTLIVVGPGTVEASIDTIDSSKTVYDAESQTYTFTYKTYRGDVITFTATPDEGFRVGSWSGTDKDPSWNTNTNVLTVDGSTVVRVEFEQDVIRLLKVPTEYRTIEEAVQAADQHGTRIIVDRGIHTVTSPAGIDFMGKNVTLMSTDPDDPEVIANTIIDCSGARFSNTRAFHFHSGEDFNTKVIGFTIKNGYINGGNGVPGRYAVPTPQPYELEPDNNPDPNQTPPRAEEGASITGNGYGGGILCENGSSPTIENCVITNCTVTGAHGGDGSDGQFVPYGLTNYPANWTYQPEDPTVNPQTSSDGQWGGHGGDGQGNGYGGAIACLTASCPIITNCIIRDNSALGGMGGDAGDGGTSASGLASGGGNGGWAIGDGIGGGIYSDSQSCPIVTDCNFVNNIASTGIPGEGGAIGPGGTHDPPATVGATGLAISFGGIAGGAAYFGDISDANFADCEFTNNKAYISSSSLNVLTNTIAVTYTYTRGSAIFSQINNTVDVKNCKFMSNPGGAIYCDVGCALNVDDCIFRDNVEASEGGAIYIAGRAKMDVNNTIFGGNSALSDGGAILSLGDADFADCTFSGNIAAENGGAVEAYYDTGNPEVRVMLRLNFERCDFTGNRASSGLNGWGGAVHFQDFVAKFTDCSFIGNTAKNGGAMLFSGGDVTINGGLIDRNRAIGGSGITAVSTNTISLSLPVEFDLHAIFDSENYLAGLNLGGTGDVGGGRDIGGGIVFADTQASIENCTLSNNAVEGLNGSGGAINFYGGAVEHSVKNCLLTDNSASVDGGAISCNLFAKPEIKDCTFAKNRTDGMGGAIFCDWSSDAKISDSIFQSNNNGAIAEEDSGDTTVKYSVFDNNPDGDYKLYNTADKQVNTSSGTELGSTNIVNDPLFVTGPLGMYYLSHIATGQDVNSPAVDAGSTSAENLGLSDYTTRIDGQGDEGTVDIGYHFPDQNDIPEYTLTATVAGGRGTIQPTSGTYFAGTPVELIATANAGWHVAEWFGTYNDASTSSSNIVIMNSDKNVAVRFEQVRTLDVPGDYTDIPSAIQDANDGDIIVIAPGVYSYEPAQHLVDGDIITIDNLAITIASTNPEDPCVVSATIIDGRFIMSNVGRDMILNGLTITNSNKNLVSEMLNPSNPPPGLDGTPGVGHMGGGIMLMGNASPTILNCVFDACYVRGPHGANGIDGDGADGWGGNGGWAGWAYGGAVYCGYNSNPLFKNCSFVDCYALGGDPGNGGNGQGGLPGGHGGNWEEAGYPGTHSMWEYGPFMEYWRYTGMGGAVFCNPYSSPEFEGCEFINNTTYGGSSGISGQPFVVTWPRQHYKIDSFGGAVFAAENSSPTFTDCFFSGNVADINGPSTHFRDNVVPINYDPYISYGGAIAYEDSAKLTFNNCTFNDNLATIGGGIWGRWADLTISDSNFVDNVGYHGGGVYVVGGSTEIGRSFFNQNQALIDVNIPSLNNIAEPNDPNALVRVLGEGGALHFFDADAAIYDCNITKNEAFAGAGIYWSYTNMTIADCNIADSNAYHGAGLYSIGSNGTISGTTVTRNRAVILPLTTPILPTTEPNNANVPLFDPNISLFGQGGGYYNMSSVMDITNSIFSNNEANGSGGGIFYSGIDLKSSFTPRLHNTLLIDNKAGTDGGGVSVNWYAAPTISNCTISGNKVSGTTGSGPGYGGGLYCSNASNVEVINSIIWDNVSAEGAEVAVVTGTDKESLPSTISITHSDIGPQSDPNLEDPLIAIAKSGVDSQQTIAGPQTSGSGKLIDGSSIYRKFNQGQQKVKIIVTLAEPDIRKTTNWDDPQSLSQLRTNLTSRLASVLSTLTSDEFTTRRTYQNVAAFSGEVSREGLNKLLTHSLVRFIEPMRYDHFMLAQALPQANALEVRQAYSGKGISIAIVDTGVDYSHPMLGGTQTFPNTKVIGGYDFGDGDSDPMPRGTAAGINPVMAHGTACAGIAAGNLGFVGNYVGGVAYDARIYALKLAPDSNDYPALPRDAEIAAWDWCITHRNDDPVHPIKVISNSWGGGPWTDDPAVGDAASPAMTTLADTSVGLGITILASSGNEFSAGQGIAWPSCMSNVISVGATYDAADLVLPYSNTDENLDILAPADPVYTTDIVGAAGFSLGDYVPNFNGTSSACPFAAGCVASVQNAALEKVGRYLTPAEIRKLLVSTGDPITDTKVAITKPRVNLAAAIRSPSGPPIYVEKDCIINNWLAPVTNSYPTWDTISWDGNVIEEDPNFIVGYYLSQFATGQITQSNCVDGGSDLASVIGLDSRTTRIDGVNDANIVDMGYHYDRGAAQYRLIVTIGENPNDPGIHGLVDPNSGLYYKGTELTLTATPDEGYYLQGWYDANGVLISNAKQLDVVMDANQVLEARFRLPRKIEVSGQDISLSQAVNSAQNGDTLVVAAGRYDGDIDFRGKEIKLVSTNPDDPNIIAETIIDCGGTTRAFTFNNGEGPGSMINGFTIINGTLFADHGGAIYIGPDSSPTIVNVTISDCRVTYGSGGAIYIDANSAPTFRNVTINNCATVGISVLTDPNDPNSVINIGGGNGGGVYLSTNSSPVFTNCNILDCSTDGSGGAVYCGSYSSALFTSCNFENNNASLSGGGIYHASNSGSMFNLCMLNNNQADYSGGGIYYNIACSSEVTDCNFAGNSALGAVTTSILTDPNDPNTLVTTTDNSPVGMGGGIYCNSDSHITVAGSVFERNSAEEGGGFYLDVNSVGDIYDCNIAENTSTRGGGLFCINCPESRIINCSINYNEAVNVVTTTQYFLPDPNDANAPPVPIQPSDPAFNPNDPNLIVIQNQDRSGVGQGGGIYSFSGPLLIADCQVSYNNTSTSGGAIYFAGSEYKTINLRNCLLTNNIAGRDGGGISNNWQNKLVISNCTIADNTLTGIYSFGGGFYGSYNSNTVITNSIIWKNSAGRGSQIAMASDDPADPLPSVLKISNSNIDLRVGETVTLVDPNFVPVIRPGFNEFSLPANDDLSTGAVNIGFTINYFGDMTSTLYVNNNGNVTFDSPLWTFTPFALTTNIGTPIIAPFFADVDTRTGTIVTYGSGMVDGRTAFGVNWVNVGYFATHVDKLNSFQLILINRSDRAPGDFDIEFNYGNIDWETGDASGGQDGFGGFSARAGFSHGSGNPGTYFEIAGSGVNGAFLDSNLNTGLVHSSRYSSVLGRYIFTVARGALDIGLYDIPIYVEEGCIVEGWDPNDPTYPLDPNAPSGPWDPSTNNIAVDPNFVAGYYLSQIASGQDVDSPCVNAGSGNVDDPDIGLSDYTTRTDGVSDVNIVDLGYHYTEGLLGYHLTVTVIADPNDPNDPFHGYVEPNDVTIYAGFDNNVIRLVAHPDDGYKVKKWTGTDNDASIRSINTVTLTGDKVVTVEFEPADKYKLTVRVIDRGEGTHGTVQVDPNSPDDMYFDGMTITLTAIPEPGYRVKVWTGTDDDTSTSLNNTVTISGTNAVVTVEFWQPVPSIITVPGDYQRIQDAVTAAQDGDTIVVDSGVYYGQDQALSLVIDKAVYITSRDPHDPCTVESTIIRGNFTISPWQNIGIIFAADATLNGFTIEDFGGNVADGDDGDRTDGIPNGVDGGSLDGAGIEILSQTSPVIKNCIIRNNVINAGNGGNGVNADADNNAGRGGWGGWAHGAGIYCGAYSSPQLINCRIENNVARGGSGGNGGDYDDQGGYANYGGNYSREGSTIFPIIDYPTDPNINTYEIITEGNLWEIWGYIGDYRVYSAYGGGVYCDIGSNVTLESCEIRGNRTYGGMSGQGGVSSAAGRQIEPLVPYEIPSYGGGVYCAAGSSVIFTGCTLEDNIASETEDPANPNHSLSPYVGYGGGVCAENSALVSFTDCNFVDNQADTGGGIYVGDTQTTIIDCNIATNEALRGGGFFGIRGMINIKSSVISNNQAVQDVNDPNDDDVLSIGAGLCFWSVNANIFDCTIRGNRAQGAGGGAYLRGDNESLLRNCLVINNAVGRDGGGLSVNWYARPTIANCTFSGNAASGAEGESGNTGLGGALYSGYNSDVTVIDSILWNNYGLKGQEIAVGGGFILDQLCGSVSVKHSDVKPSLNHVWVDPNCDLSLKASDGNIDADPLFVGGRNGLYYLSNSGAGQQRTSPCVDAGSDFASHLSLLGYTTRTDDIRDTGIVDMGYHYNMEDKCRFADLVFDGVIDVRDFDKFAQILGFADFEVAMEKWLEEPLDLPSSEADGWRGGTDITTDMRVNGDDLQFLIIDCNGVADINAPTPNPSKWEIEPYWSYEEASVSMKAAVAFDAWTRNVEYYFQCVTPGGHDSGWQSSPIYTDTNLDNSIAYGYRIRTRDGVQWVPEDGTGVRGNKTEWSQVAYTGVDNVPPAPAPRIETIDSNTPTSVTMLATDAYDYSGVEYYFENINDHSHDSGWRDDPNYTDVGLDPNTLYGYRVKARDKSSRQNETGWSEIVYVRTQVPPDVDPPTPNPMQWDLTVDPNGFDGTPHEVNRGGGTFDYYADMTAVVAVDAGGGPVEYYFECGDEHGFDSGWIATPTYSVLIGRSGQGLLFRVRARDQFGNMTDWSPWDRAD